MKTRELTKFTQDDLNKLRVFKTILLQAEYPLKGDAITAVASLFDWFDGLKIKIEDSIKKDKMDGAPKVGSIE